MRRMQKDAFLQFYEKAQGVKNITTMRKLLRNLAANDDEKSSIGSIPAEQVKQLFSNVYSQGELLANKGAVMELFSYNPSFYPVDFSPSSLPGRIAASNSSETYVQGAHHIAFISRDNPFTFKSIHAVLGHLGGLTKLEALTFEMDHSRQEFLDKSFKEGEKVKMQDVGSFALIANYALQKGIRSYAADDFNLTSNERAHYTSVRLNKLHQSHTFLVHIGSKSQADKVIRVLNG